MDQTWHVAVPERCCFGVLMTCLCFFPPPGASSNGWRCARSARSATCQCCSWHSCTASRTQALLRVPYLEQRTSYSSASARTAPGLLGGTWRRPKHYGTSKGAKLGTGGWRAESTLGK